MRKYAAILILFVLSSLFTSCVNKDKESKNFLGGYGEISPGAYSDLYYSAFFEDDVYIYYDIYKINKQSGQFAGLCENAGCAHNTANCLEYRYAGKVFPAGDKIFFAEGRELYYIDMNGKTTYIDKFETDENGVTLDDYIVIDKVCPINSRCIFVSCGNGSCIYNLDTKERLYISVRYFCGNDENIYYYDKDAECIFCLNTDSWGKKEIDNTRLIYPCAYSEGSLYCNTDTGVICCVDADYKIEVLLSDENVTYTLLGMNKDRLYYMCSDINLMTGDYTYCDIYSANADGANAEKLNVEGLLPDMSQSCFFNDNNIYMLKKDGFNIIETYVYSISENKCEVYKNGLKTSEDYLYPEGQKNDTDEEETEPRASFTIVEDFYAETTDPLTGNKVTVSQKKEPFVVDGNRLRTTFYYNVDVEGNYPKEGVLNVFVMCDGIIQSSSIDGGEDKLINQVAYIDEEDMYAELEFELDNASPDSKIFICDYLSDSIITDDFTEFGNHYEMVSFRDFQYRLSDGYTLEYEMLKPVYSNRNFTEVYTPEENEKHDDIPEIAAVSDTVPLEVQSERWNIEFEKNGKLYIIFHNRQGQYNLYVLVDDKPVMLNESNEDLLCDISGDYDSVVYETDVSNIISDNEKHTVKIISYDRSLGLVTMYHDQIIQVKD